MSMNFHIKVVSINTPRISDDKISILDVRIIILFFVKCVMFDKPIYIPEIMLEDARSVIIKDKK